ncbi:nuclear transport factor 2 family protein [Bosea sp. 685]|uniref:nuclear transport factor 2 family protein n=1 Tax=Bosea sp. 685 TaxID=3080057 RepID=UPI002893804F|nr:nuclear transport factor 2 family protein [Bosea sp. 685]WNJ93615.1 nuclear transport factor 2 family protein [Bosea sp. 685]
MIKATNAFDIECALALFTSDAIIEDPSVGESFIGHAGIRDYLERFFVGYHTVTRLLSVEVLGEDHVRMRVDFTGDFGHEIGLLEMSVNADGLIVRINADLE